MEVVAVDLVVVDAEDGDLFGDLQSGLPGGDDHVLCAAVPGGQHGGRLGQPFQETAQVFIFARTEDGLVPRADGLEERPFAQVRPRARNGRVDERMGAELPEGGEEIGGHPSDGKVVVAHVGNRVRTASHAVGANVDEDRRDPGRGDEFQRARIVRNRRCSASA